MFALAHFAYSKNILSGTTVEYGVVPCPMYDEEQREYITYYGNPTSFWGIPSNVSDVDMCCTLLEYLAADAYVYISPAIFEKALKYKYVNGEGANGLSKMFDIIRDGLVFDACMFYYTHIGGTNYRQFTELTGTGTSWVKNFQGFKLTSMKSSMKGLVTKLRELPY